MRSGAHPGDAIYVTGYLGMAALGLACLKEGNATDAAQPFIERYRAPRPRVDEGQKLAATGFITAMIDISDGLMADVDHLAQASQTGYEIHVDKLPKAVGMDDIAHLIKADPLQLMLGGGDDYELAFTVAHDHRKDFDRWYADGKLGTYVPLTKVGRITEDPEQRVGLAADGTEIDITMRGFDHFTRNTNAS